MLSWLVRHLGFGQVTTYSMVSGISARNFLITAKSFIILIDAKGAKIATRFISSLVNSRFSTLIMSFNFIFLLEKFKPMVTTLFSSAKFSSRTIFKAWPAVIWSITVPALMANTLYGRIFVDFIKDKRVRN